MTTTGKKQRKIKRLKKKRIWPTLVSLPLLLIFLVFASTFYLEAFTIIMILPQVAGSAKCIDGIVDKLGNGPIGEKEAAKLLPDCVSEDIEQFYLYDDENNPIYQGGELIPPLLENAPFYEQSFKGLDEWIGIHEFVVEYMSNRDSAAYGEENALRDLMHNGILDRNTLISRFLDRGTARFRVWFTVPLQDGKYILYAENPVFVSYKDQLLLMLCALFLFVMTALPFVMYIVTSVGGFISQGRLTKLYYFDAVTLGKNWLCFKDRAGRLMRWCGKKGRYAVVCLHVDKYRNYCTCYGTAEGERLLEEINGIVNGFIRRREAFARHSGAEFGLLLFEKQGESIEQRVMELENCWRLQRGGEPSISASASARLRVKMETWRSGMSARAWQGRPCRAIPRAASRGLAIR